MFGFEPKKMLLQQTDLWVQVTSLIQNYLGPASQILLVLAIEIAKLI